MVFKFPTNANKESEEMSIYLAIVWDVATCGGTLIYKHDEPTSFFFHPVSICFLLVARTSLS